MPESVIVDLYRNCLSPFRRSCHFLFSSVVISLCSPMGSGCMISQSGVVGGSRVSHSLSPPSFCCCSPRGQQCAPLSRTVPLRYVERPFLVSAVFFLFHFGTWVRSSLPIPFSTTSLLSGDRSRTSFLSRLSRLRKWRETKRVVCSPVPLKTLHWLFTYLVLKR